jgi:hypothetical protein
LVEGEELAVGAELRARSSRRRRAEDEELRYTVEPFSARCADLIADLLQHLRS